MESDDLTELAWDAVPILTGGNFPIWQIKMFSYLKRQNLLDVCENDQGETPSDAIQRQMHQATFRLGAKMADTVFTSIFPFYDETPFEIWSKLKRRYTTPTPFKVFRFNRMMEQIQFDGDMSKFTEEIENCLLEFQCIRIDVMDPTFCARILYKLFDEQREVVDSILISSSKLSDPFLLLERLRTFELFSAGSRSDQENARQHPGPTTNKRRTYGAPNRCPDGTHNPNTMHTPDECRGLHPELRRPKKLRSST